MTSYAGFKDMGDYLTTRCRERDLSFQALSEAIGATHAYIHSITTGQFGVSPKRADAIADFFGDSRKVIRILAGIETPSVEEDKDLSGLKEIAATLTLRSRRELIRYAQYLKSGEDHGT
jgi:cyanate lyase